MRALLAAALFAGTAAALPVQAGGLSFHTQCSVSSDYDLQVTPAGVTFDSAEASPHQVFMHDGQVRIDGRPLAISQTDAARVRRYETQVRALLPDVVGVAREGMDIGFEALDTVATTLGSPDERDHLVSQLNDQQTKLRGRLDAELAAGQWRHDDFDRWLDQGLGDAIGELVGDITRTAVTAALSGDHARLDALQERGESLDRRIDRALQARTGALEKRVDALCPRLQALDRLQHQFEFRLPDGSPLRVWRLEEKDTVAGTGGAQP